jgi:L-ribulose-5-phosphate 3-epimerase UlaE
LSIKIISLPVCFLIEINEIKEAVSKIRDSLFCVYGDIQNVIVWSKKKRWIGD